jgi:hypothetical protein
MYFFVDYSKKTTTGRRGRPCMVSEAERRR